MKCRLFFLLGLLAFCFQTDTCQAQLADEQKALIDREYVAQADSLIFTYNDMSVPLEASKMPPPPVPDTDRIKVVQASADNGGIESMVYYPKTARDKYPLVFFLHEGGYLFRSLYYNYERFLFMADKLEAAVVVPRYPMVFENPFPGAIEASYKALEYFIKEHKSYHFDKNKTVLMGGSAGGNLAQALALYNLDNSNIKISFVALLYPMLDYKTGSETNTLDDPKNGQIVWNRKSNAFAWSVLKPDRELSEKEFGYFSPTYAKKLEDLPPTGIYVGSIDLFAPECLEFASRLAKSNVKVSLHLYAGEYHIFDIIKQDSKVTSKLYDDLRFDISQVSDL
ncbi:MAG: alpha/beta hydrolase [Succinivibrio sp.]